MRSQIQPTICHTAPVASAPMVVPSVGSGVVVVVDDVWVAGLDWFANAEIVPAEICLHFRIGL